MQKEKSFRRQSIYWLSIAIVGFVVGIGIQFTQAWSNPSTTPPTGNVAGPITTGSVGQWKTGSLGIGTSGLAADPLGWGGNLEVRGGAKAVRYYDDDPNFFVDANSTSIMNVVRGSSFSDRENTGYYLDPNNTNRLNYVLANNLDSFDWVRGTRFIDRNDGNYYLDPNNGNRLNYVLANNLDSYGWVRGVDFIDRNDGAYHVDPNGNSRMNGVYANYVYSYGNMDANDYYVRSIGKWVSQLKGTSACTLQYRFFRNSVSGAWGSVTLNGTSNTGSNSAWRATDLTDECSGGETCGIQMRVVCP